MFKLELELVEVLALVFKLSASGFPNPVIPAFCGAKLGDKAGHKLELPFPFPNEDAPNGEPGIGGNGDTDVVTETLLVEDKFGGANRPVLWSNGEGVKILEEELFE